VGLVDSNKALIHLDSVHFGVGQGTVATHGSQMSWLQTYCLSVKTTIL